MPLAVKSALAVVLNHIGGNLPKVTTRQWIGDKYMSSIEVGGKALATDEEGYLDNLADWTPEVAAVMAGIDDCDLTENHWEVINFLRGYYEEYEIAPAVRILTKAIGKKLGKEFGNAKYLYELYPNGPAKQACKYAGLPKPTGCV